jgi:hypothetical protein
MVFEEVRVFVKVDGFKGKFSQAFPTVSVGCGVRGDTTTTKFGPGTVLVVHGEVRIGLSSIERMK